MTGIQRVHDSNSHCENLLFWDYRIHAHVHKPFDIANLQPFSVLLSIRIYLSEKALHRQGGRGLKPTMADVSAPSPLTGEGWDGGEVDLHWFHITDYFETVSHTNKALINLQVVWYPDLVIYVR